MKTEREALALLKSLAPVVVSHDLSPAILAKVRKARRGWPQFRRYVYPLAAAATLVLLLGGMWMAVSGTADPGRRALAWLRHTQEPDGSWSAAKWGGNEQFEIALTGLSLMALLDGTPGGGPAIEKAIAYLIQHQQADGRFGNSFSSAPYNQGIATLALAKAYQKRRDEIIRPVLDRAVSLICACQQADGGWGYHGDARQDSNLSVSLWQIEALRLALEQGWTQVQPNLERGLRWMAGVASDDGSFGYQRRGDTSADASQTLTAMGAMSLLDPMHAGLVSLGRRQAIEAQIQRLAANPGPEMDYYHRYFLSAAIRKMDQKPARRDLTAIRHQLVKRQIKRGAEAGSWKADDRWGSSGGRIYATAMASLSLKERL